MGPSSLLRGIFSERDIQRVPVPLSARGSVWRAKAACSAGQKEAAPVLCSHLSPASALCYLMQEDEPIMSCHQTV